MSVYEVIGKLPDVRTVRDRSRAMAMLDAILCPEWGYRHHSFDRSWSQTQELASMRDGSGNDYSIVFSAAGAYARAFDHESPMTPWRSEPLETWPGLFDTVPDAFRALVLEPAFCESEGTPRATVCFWRQAADADWNTGNVDLPSDIGDADGAEWLFDVLVAGTADAYRKFAEEYYEVTLDVAAVQRVYDLELLSAEIVSALNPEIELADLTEDIAQIGYPALNGEPVGEA
ncbi:hypothetical protein [Peterkaempfera sp. SMS 1(5)a]|uniref:hypothetical protein n=1 Tax=Peterkaempfera podocarpi TaxID=3232308 RepID=UPI00366D9CF3